MALPTCAIQSIGCFLCEGMFLLRNAFQTSESHGLFEVAVYFNDSFPSHQNSWDPSMMGFDRWRMNCSINCESRFGTWEEMLRFLGRKDHGSGRGDVDPKSFTILNMDSLGPIIFRFHCWKSGDVFCWCFWGSQVFVWELDQQSGMSWESLEGFFHLEMVSVLYMDIVPGWLSKRQERLRAQAEQRVREQGSSGKETERLRSGKKITTGFATNHKPRSIAEVCVFFPKDLAKGVS